ncbi:ArnT family glycosyltransferase [Patescibacteria group bacterium]
MKNKKALLLIIVILAFVLRFFALGLNPPEMFFDEMALGYNAFSIAKTGMDEHGNSFPTTYFTSFGDYKPPVYIYAAVPMIKFFGLNSFTTRLPSALFGTLTVLLTYFLVLEIFKPKKEKHVLALLSTLLLAISPWHIFLSRVAYEANLAQFFIVLSIYLFLKSFKNKCLLILAAIFAGLSMYTFNSARLGVPLIFTGFIFYFFRKIKKNTKGLIISLVIGSIFIVGLIPHLTSKEGKIRYNEVNIFSNLDVIKDSNRRIEEDGNNILSRLVHNRRISYSLLFLKHYFDNFDLRFLFLNGDVNPRLHNQETGQLYLIELPLFLLGIYFLVKKKGNPLFIIFYWLLAGLIPASTARETPHALRSEIVLPIWQIITAVGIYYFFSKFKNKLFKFSFVFLYFISFFYFVHNYFCHYPKQFASFWYSGLKSVTQYAYEKQNDYETIIFPDLGRSYIAFLFYNSFDPLSFQKANKIYTQSAVLSGDLFVTKQMDKYYFHMPNEDLDTFNKPILLITPDNSMNFEASPIMEFHDVNNQVIYSAWEIK